MLPEQENRIDNNSFILLGGMSYPMQILSLAMDLFVQCCVGSENVVK